MSQVHFTAAASDSPPSSERYEEFLSYYSKYQLRLFRYVLVLVPHWNDAEEIFQETSLVLWRSFDDFTPGTDFFRWAAKVAFHQVLSFRRRQKRLPLYQDTLFIEAIAQEAVRQEDLLEARMRALQNCLTRLRPRDQELVRLSYGRQSTLKAVAAQMGRPVDTVYKALRRIRTRLEGCVNRRLALDGAQP